MISEGTDAPDRQSDLTFLRSGLFQGDSSGHIQANSFYFQLVSDLLLGSNSQFVSPEQIKHPAPWGERQE